MPRAKSICLRHGCIRTTLRNGRCGNHQLRRGWDRTSPRNAARPGDWSSRRARALAHDHFRCRICGARENLEVDHIVPVSRGGSWEPANLQTLCRSCHRTKTYSNTEGGIS
ncbi:HNH endonuclease [Kitasatospora sp. NPDC059646]|uniref:HNH endonuclease n=1 Tax=Kitasatospora sp. NPDC059646 TaxID=3346893 RepID=UPI0036B16894